MFSYNCYSEDILGVVRALKANYKCLVVKIISLLLTALFRFKF